VAPFTLQLKFGLKRDVAVVHNLFVKFDSVAFYLYKKVI
jgi:hypothetical protein